jgi:hypothetical protein
MLRQILSVSDECEHSSSENMGPKHKIGFIEKSSNYLTSVIYEEWWSGIDQVLLAQG